LDYLEQKAKRSWNDLRQDATNVPLNSDISHSLFQCNVTVHTLNNFPADVNSLYDCAKISLVYT